MQLQQIDKQRYSKHYKQVFIGVVILMMAIALPVSSGLIYLLGSEESNFWLNVAGVVVAAFVVVQLFRRYRNHEYLFEVLYVWDLKQMLNKIYRKQKAIKAAMAEGDRDAMVIMNWSYKGSKQLYTLDNNTITMEELNSAMSDLDKLIEQYDYSVTLEDFSPELLEKY